MALTSAIDGASAPPAERAVSDARTVPALFIAAARDRASQTAMRWKRRGIWQAVIWEDYANAVGDVACALLARGVRRGDRVAILSENRPEWLYVDLAAQCAGSIAIGIDASESIDVIAGALANSAARILFVDTAEQLDAALAASAKAPALECIVHFDDSVGKSAARLPVISFDAFRRDGHAFAQRDPERWQSEASRAKPDDVAIIARDLAGAGKTVGLSHRDLLARMAVMSQLCPGATSGEQLSILPLDIATERVFTAYWPLATGAIVNFGEGASPLDGLREIAPQIVMATPAIYESLQAGIVGTIAEASRAGRLAYRAALDTAFAIADRRTAGAPISLRLKFASFLANGLVLNRARAMIGLQRARLLLSAGGPMPPQLSRWYGTLDLIVVDAPEETACAGHASADGRGWRLIDANDTLA